MKGITVKKLAVRILRILVFALIFAYSLTIVLIWQIVNLFAPNNVLVAISITFLTFSFLLWLSCCLFNDKQQDDWHYYDWVE